MQITGNRTQQARLTIRVSKNTLSFSVVDREAEHQLIYEPYTVKSGVSIAANLRQAFSESDLLQRGYTKVRVYIDSPILLVPIEEFHEEDLPVLYQHAFTGHNGDVILHKVQPNLNVVAVFPINKDLKMVVEDNFKDVRFTPIMQPIWNYLHQRSFTGIHRKLYAYFHDKKVDIFCYEKNRFKFFNSFKADHAKDALYFILYVWKQVGMDQVQDELHVAGDVPDKDWFLYNAKIYIKKTFLLNPSAEFNRAPITEIKGMPFDLVTLYLSNLKSATYRV
ncbi:DUF3822 family protein [Segatella copri]|uniref:DUF3822 family protein n=1 Tax=Segatella copri TaxID=165179 RepID=UPI001931C8D5|nr:DUF3822 family protein [Segatella copri]MBM0131141.1 DUF3822 family protein [Segatella copri]